MSDLRESARAALGPFSLLEPSLFERCVRHVLDGEDSGLPRELSALVATIPRAYADFERLQATAEQRGARRTFYVACAALSLAAPLARFAAVNEPVSIPCMELQLRVMFESERTHVTTYPERLPGWPEFLTRDIRATGASAPELDYAFLEAVLATGGFSPDYYLARELSIGWGPPVPGIAGALKRHAVSVRRFLSEGTAEKRASTFERLRSVAGDALGDFAAEIVSGATAPAARVRRAASRLVVDEPRIVAELQALAASGPASRRGYAQDLLRALELDRARPPDIDALPELGRDAPLLPATRAAFDAALAAIAPGIDGEAVDRLWRYVRGEQSHAPPPYLRWNVSEGRRPVPALWSSRDVALGHVVRLFLGLRGAKHFSFDDDFMSAIDALRLRGVPVDFSLLEAHFASMGLPVESIGLSYLSGHLGADWPPADVVPYFMRHSVLLEKALYGAAFQVISSFAAIPERIVNQLVELALGTAGEQRMGARAALARYPQRTERALAALASRPSERRAAAASWLGEIGDETAVGHLESALEKERDDAVKAAIIGALRRLGVSPERYLSRSNLVAQASQALEKGIPAEMEWFPIAPPPVRWADSGELVEPVVLRWFLVQACKLRTPEPSENLRCYVHYFDPADRARFGAFVLRVWLERDLTPRPREAAELAARRYAEGMYALLNGPYAHAGEQRFAGKSPEEIYRSVLPAALKQPVGSAIPAKGVLAVAGACCGGDAVAPIVSYLTEWYGQRAAQCKALVVVLAWIDDPVATQALLSVASRFRTKGIQEDALRQVRLLSERRGWSVDELADRTIPSAGFDEAGALALSYGSRVLSARLTDALGLEIADETGRVLTALPEARQADDPVAVRRAKTDLATARKELKLIEKVQSTRLYEAMCGERTWRFEDWDRYLRSHAIVGRLCRRIIWQTGEGRDMRTFRPMADGTIRESAGRILLPPPDALVRIAHSTSVDTSTIAAWIGGFKDFSAPPPFTQFRVFPAQLDEARGAARQLHDFEGHIVDSRALRAQATKHGWSHGEVGDGPSIVTYEKRFATLDILAVLDISIAEMPIRPQPVALRGLGFKRLGRAGGAPPHSLTLAAVPRALLAECWNDVRSFAAAGTGFDPDWQQKTES